MLFVINRMINQLSRTCFMILHVVVNHASWSTCFGLVLVCSDPMVGIQELDGVVLSIMVPHALLSRGV